MSIRCLKRKKNLHIGHQRGRSRILKIRMEEPYDNGILQCHTPDMKNWHINWSLSRPETFIVISVSAFYGADMLRVYRVKFSNSYCST